eukprot:2091302-Prymnesium_polylepis.3
MRSAVLTRQALRARATSPPPTKLHAEARSPLSAAYAHAPPKGCATSPSTMTARVAPCAQLHCPATPHDCCS